MADDEVPPVHNQAENEANEHVNEHQAEDEANEHVNEHQAKDHADIEVYRPDFTSRRTKPPKPLSLLGNEVESWKLFKKRWQNYTLLSGLQKKTCAFQVAELENCLEDDTLKILESFCFTTPEHMRSVKEILDKFEEYVVGEVNETYERFMFGSRSQQEDEPVDKFLSEFSLKLAATAQGANHPS